MHIPYQNGGGYLVYCNVAEVDQIHKLKRMLFFCLLQLLQQAMGRGPGHTGGHYPAGDAPRTSQTRKGELYDL